MSGVTAAPTTATPPPDLRADARVDRQITDVGGLVALAMALVTVFTAARAQAGIRRRQAEGLTRADMVGELVLDLGLLLLTVGVMVATAPIVLDALGRQEIGRNAGALRLTIVVVWVLLCALSVWQLTIAKGTLAQYGRVWDRTRK